VSDISPDAELLERHKPILRYDSQGSFSADSAQIMPERAGNALKREDGKVVAKPAELELEFLGARKYGDASKVEKTDYLDATGRDYVLDARALHANPDYADRAHGHLALDDKGGRWLQYWFFYYFNNKAFLGFGLHEGDWEMVQIGLDANDEPQSMTFAQHEHGERCKWKDVKKRGRRPIVYVARGSQASYPRAGRHRAPIVPDHADGEGAEVSSLTLELLDAPAARWVGWPGRWGSSRPRNVAESNSPRGPKQHGQWDKPAEFHADAVERDDFLGKVFGQPELRGAPAPRIKARRVRGRAVVDYRFPQPARGEAPVTQIVVSVDSPDDGLPPATYSFPVERPDGRVKHPLPLEDRRYVVLASGYTREAVGSETVETPLR
jgi:hypothetical protein